MLHMYYLGVFAFCEHFCSSEWHVNSTPGMSSGWFNIPVNNILVVYSNSGTSTNSHFLTTATSLYQPVFNKSKVQFYSIFDLYKAVTCLQQPLLCYGWLL